MALVYSFRNQFLRPISAFDIVPNKTKYYRDNFVSEDVPVVLRWLANDSRWKQNLLRDRRLVGHLVRMQMNRHLKWWKCTIKFYSNRFNLCIHRNAITSISNSRNVIDFFFFLFNWINSVKRHRFSYNFNYSILPNEMHESNAFENNLM